MIKRKRFSKNFATYKKARHWLQTMEKEADSGIAGLSEARLDEYLRKWFRIYGPSIREKTSTDFHRYIFKYLIPHIGEITLGNLSPLNIDQYYQFLFAEAGKSASTIKHLHSVLHRALQYAVEKHLLPNNPANGATLPRQEKTEKKIWSLDEIRTFMNTAKLFPFEIVYYLASKQG